MSLCEHDKCRMLKRDNLFLNKMLHYQRLHDTAILRENTGCEVMSITFATKFVVL